MKGFHDKEKGIGIFYDDIFLVNGARTPFGKFCGTLGQISPTDLGIYASRATLEKASVKGAAIDQIIAANVGQSSADTYFFAKAYWTLFRLISGRAGSYVTKALWFRF